MLDRDALELGRVEHRAALPRLLRQLAASSTTLFNATDLARTLALNAATFRFYLELLELVFLTVRLPAWSSNLPKGPLFESIIALEILRLISSSAIQALPYHLRIHEGWRWP